MKRLFISLVLSTIMVISFGKPAEWNVDKSDYEFSMTITGVVETSESLADSNSDYVAAYINGECRGVVELVDVADQDKPFAYLTVFSNNSEGEDVVFKYYSGADENTSDCINDIRFKDGRNLGTVSVPFVFCPDTVNYSIDVSMSSQQEGNTEDPFIGVLSITERENDRQVDYGLPADLGDNHSFFVSNDSLFAKEDLEEDDYEIDVEVQTFDGLTFSETLEFEVSGDGSGGSAGIGSANQAAIFSFYPNPCHDVLTIETTDLAFDEALFFNVTGNLVKRIELDQDKTRIDVSGIQAGLYIIKFAGGSFELIKRLVIE